MSLLSRDHQHKFIRHFKLFRRFGVVILHQCNSNNLQLPRTTTGSSAFFWPTWKTPLILDHFYSTTP